jgi:hypothetical protein
VDRRGSRASASLFRRNGSHTTRFNQACDAVLGVSMPRTPRPRSRPNLESSRELHQQILPCSFSESWQASSRLDRLSNPRLQSQVEVALDTSLSPGTTAHPSTTTSASRSGRLFTPARIFRGSQSHHAGNVRTALTDETCYDSGNASPHSPLWRSDLLEALALHPAQVSARDRCR